MLRKSLIAAATLAFVATPAFTFHCPADMAKIDAAMQTASLTPEQEAQVKQLRAKGQELHEAGNHQESVQVLGQAMTILGIQ
jgi:hypothetical protein